MPFKFNEHNWKTINYWLPWYSDSAAQPMQKDETRLTALGVSSASRSII